MIIYNSEIYHYGIPRRSGRYKWGSGKNPFHHGADAAFRKAKADYKANKKAINKGHQKSLRNVKDYRKVDSMVKNYKDARRTNKEAYAQAKKAYKQTAEYKAARRKKIAGIAAGTAAVAATAYLARHPEKRAQMQSMIKGITQNTKTTASNARSYGARRAKSARISGAVAASNAAESVRNSRIGGAAIKARTAGADAARNARLSARTAYGNARDAITGRNLGRRPMKDMMAPPRDIRGDIRGAASAASKRVAGAASNARSYGARRAKSARISGAVAASNAAESVRNSRIGGAAIKARTAGADAARNARLKARSITPISRYNAYKTPRRDPMAQPRDIRGTVAGAVRSARTTGARVAGNARTAGADAARNAKVSGYAAYINHKPRSKSRREADAIAKTQDNISAEWDRLKKKSEQLLDDSYGNVVPRRRRVRR